MLRSRQFPEDAGPLAHPIRPESYIVMDNFYTATVYIKGAEVGQPPAPSDARQSAPVGTRLPDVGLGCCLPLGLLACRSIDRSFSFSQATCCVLRSALRC